MTQKSASLYPAVLFVYQRPTLIVHQLDILRQANIPLVYVFADAEAATSSHAGVQATRQALSAYQAQYPHFPLRIVYRRHNLGLRQNIVRGLDAVFAEVEAAIIIEDDCYFGLDFLHFAQTMLARYRHTPNIYSVSGTSVGGKTQFSYDFCPYPHPWGWATWRRAWAQYSADFAGLDTAAYHQSLTAGYLRWYFDTLFHLVRQGQIDTWDCQWTYTHLRDRALAIMPSVNLVANQGFDQYATNTRVASRVANLPVGSLDPEALRHPPHIAPNRSLATAMEQHFYANPIAFLGLIRQQFYAWMGVKR